MRPCKSARLPGNPRPEIEYETGDFALDFRQCSETAHRLENPWSHCRQRQLPVGWATLETAVVNGQDGAWAITIMWLDRSAVGLNANRLTFLDMSNLLLTATLIAAAVATVACAPEPASVAPTPTASRAATVLTMPSADSCLNAEAPSPRPLDSAAHVYDTAVHFLPAPTRLWHRPRAAWGRGPECPGGNRRCGLPSLHPGTRELPP